MRTRVGRIAMIVMAALLSGGPTAVAQPLNLEKRYAPAPGDGLGAARLATAMGAEAKALVELPGIDPRTQPSRCIRYALRTLAQHLLEQGELRGPDGSLLVLAGRDLAGDMPALDAWVDSGRFDETALREIASDLRESCSGDPKALASDAGALWLTLRNILAPLVDPDQIGASAWWTDSSAEPTPRRTSAAALAAGLKLGVQAVADAKTLDDLLIDARTHAAFASSAQAIDRALGLASGLTAAKPGLLRFEPKLKQEIETALAKLANPEMTQDGMLMLERAGILIDVAVRADGLKDSQASRRLCDAIFKAVTSLAGLPTAGELRRLTILRDWLIEVDAPQIARDDLDKSLRPALPVLANAAEESRANLIATLSRLLSPDAVSTDPALVSARLSHQRRLDDIRMLSDLSRALAQEPGGARGPQSLAILRTRVLKLSQDLSKPPTRDVALTELRTIAAGLAPQSRSAALRAVLEGPPPDSPAARLSQSSGGAVKRLLDAASQDWAARASREMQARQPVTPFSSELVESLEAFLFAAASTDQGNMDLLSRWPAFSLTPEAFGRITDSLRQPLAVARDALNSGDAATFLEAARPLRAANDRLWIGVLALGVPVQAVHPAGGTMPASLRKLGTGAPASRDAWQLDRVPEIALLCRYACELDQVEASKRSGLTEYLSNRARALQNTLEAVSP